METRTEEWKDIEGYEGIYQVSNLGRVRSLDRYVEVTNRWGTLSTYFYSGKVLRQAIDTKGYYMVNLANNGANKIFRVHQLVAHAFVDGWFEGAVVNHKDENKRNNLPSNLEWVTFAYNLNYGTARQRSTEGHGNSKPVEQIDAAWNITNTYSSIEECARHTNKSPRSIKRACDRYPKLVTKEGFRYKFKQ